MSKCPRIGMLVVLSALLASGGAMAQKYRDKRFNAMELARLPKFCYAQYVDEKLASDPKHSIQGCGAYMNHFCPGLVQLMRAENAANPGYDRSENLRLAKNNFKYTQNYMPAGCWLRPDLEAAMSRARVLSVTVK